jgi:hypothetical protein
MIAAHTKLVLVTDPRPVSTSPGARRYRIARLAVNPERGGGGSFEHLKRVYD